MPNQVKLGLAVLLALCCLQTRADQISNLLVEAYKSGEVEDSVDSGATSYGLERLVPVQSIEYHYGAEENESNRTHVFRLKMKSFREMTTASESHRLSQELKDLTQKSAVNQVAFEAHRQVVESILHSQLLHVISQRQKETDRLINRKLHLLSESRSSAKELLRESLGSQQLQGQLAIVQGALVGKEEISSAKAESLTQTLVSRASRLANKIKRSALQSQELRRQQLAARLEHIDKEVDWANDSKILSQVDFRYDSENRENSFRVGFNIPFARFDRSKKERESALLRSKEAIGQVKQQETKREVEERAARVQSLAEALRISQEKLAQIAAVKQRLRKSKDAEVLLAIRQSLYEMNKEVAELALEFYLTYLTHLRDLGEFSAKESVNFLDPSWAALKR